MSASSAMQFTSAQTAAIAAEGDVLVVAGAGTGKTRTLIQRCLRLLLEGTSLEHLLLVTFTEAAAAEMKARLRAGLEALIVAHPTRPHLQEQVALLDNAQICTLHSFCLQLIRDHFHELALDPQIVVLDEAQLQPLVEEAMNAALAPFLLEGARGAEPSNNLLGQLAGEGGAGLRALIWRVHRYAQTLPNPGRWLGEQEALFQENQPLRWREWLTQEFGRWTTDWLPRLEPFLDCANVQLCYEALAALGPSVDSAALQRAVESIRVADEETTWERGSKTKVRKRLERFFEEANFFRSLVSAGRGGEDPLQIDWDAVRQEMRVVLRLVRDFQKDFERSKRELGGVDFADIEQLSLRLLWDENGRALPTALRCREHFTHVFVDEVQDINAAQDAILRGVSRDGADGNRFLVGDIKQSIYRFRLANPAIFRGYLEAWRSPGGSRQVIALSDNFRSREGILRWVNALFDQVMQYGVGGVAYDEESQLRFGSPESRFRLRHSDTECRVQLCILAAEPGQGGDPSMSLDEASVEEEELLSSEREARWLASHFKQLQASGHLVWDDSLKEFRAVRWSDMVVLLRSPGAKVESYAKEFHRAGVPICAPRGGFFDSQEILDLLSLLRLLDNPIQDIPLLAVLRSPLGGFSAEDLVAIRLVDKRVPLWTALARATDPNLDGSSEGLPASCREKAARFLAQYGRWREAIRLGVLSNCLETILSDTHYEALLEAEDRGESRLANVRRLLELTRQYDPYQRQGLFRFLRFVESQQELEQDVDSAAAAAPNAVRLISIHKSKGLEFPVVAVADLNKPFNAGDLQQDVLLDETYGLCPRVVLPESGVRYSSLAHWLAQRRGRSELLGEELRLLYVALTRARDLLVLVGHGRLKDWERPTEESPTFSARPLAWEISQARSSLHWIRLWFQRHARSEFWEHPYGGRSPLLSWQIGPAAQLGMQEAKQELEPSPAALVIEGEATILGIERRVSWSYPHQAASIEPAKTTVSTLRHRQRELESEGVPLFRGKFRRSRTAAPGVVSGTEPGMSAAERGTLHHLFLQWMDLDHADSLLDLQNEGERLCRSGVFSQEELRAIRFSTLAAFWQSQLGIQIRKVRDRVQRELPFTARLSTSDLRDLGVIQPGLALADEEFVVVQGQVDLAVVLDEEIWLLDFKTDAIAVEDLEDRAKHYEIQIRIYALALEAIYGRPVTHRWLHFLTVDQTVTLGR